MRRMTEGELAAWGAALGAALPPRAIVTLRGELGAGKTTLVRALARGLGVTEPTSSPTYALVHRYAGRRGPVFHLDCYRLGSPEEAIDLDWDGLLAEGDALLIEWPERAAGWVPTATHAITLAHLPDDPSRRALEGP
ncbi:MAG: tRNA (adenosine(37)-N6)-threonylcarbamoyltransferase complex ATPase subunit type 1 TsaE [Gemmatimonadales bacterium]|nr:tRNA (adenosine(37)-N6)-threonylcarbamoyltransferase complex ATPase subunit type 1 TsaE [Gemmatimonadales bacterium]